LEILADNVLNTLAFCKMNRKKKTLGFLSLETDQNGGYWFKSVRSFHTALDTSLFALQTLLDEISMKENPDPGAVDKITSIYRMVSTIFENY
jgi:hypothetical protein